MAPTFELVITTPEREVFRGAVDSVTLPTADGEITILPHHMALATIIKPGEMVIRQGGKAEPYAIAGGFIEVQPQAVVVLADTAEHVQEIDEARAEEARQRGQALKHELAVDHTDYANVVAKLDRDLNRLRIIRKHRSRHAPHVADIKREE